MDFVVWKEDEGRIGQIHLLAGWCKRRLNQSLVSLGLVLCPYISGHFSLVSVLRCNLVAVNVVTSTSQVILLGRPGIFVTVVVAEDAENQV